MATERSAEVQRPSAVAGPPFNLLADIRTLVMKDHFMIAGTHAAGPLASQLQWEIVAAVGAADSDVDTVSGVANHPGIARLNAGGTIPADGDIGALLLGDNAAATTEQFLLDDNGIYMAALLRVPDVDAQKVEFGFTSQTIAGVNSSVLDVVSVVFDPEDAANVGDAIWFGQVNDAGTDTEVVLSDLGYAENEWVLLELAADDSGAWFRVSNGEEVDEGSISDAPIVALVPFFAVENVGAAEESVDIDAFVLRFQTRSTSPSGLSDRIYS